MGGIKEEDVGKENYFFLRLLDIPTWRDGEAWKGCCLPKTIPVPQAKNG